MGHEAKKRAEVRHFRKLFDGKMTAEEVHQSVALRDKKCPCGLPALIRCRFFAPVKDMVDKNPQFMMQLAAQHNGTVPVVETKHGKMVRFSEAYSCTQHKSALEREAAKAPSWVLVDFDYGPGPDKAIVQVPS